jgi:hypothetical protein
MGDGCVESFHGRFSGEFLALEVFENLSVAKRRPGSKVVTVTIARKARSTRERRTSSARCVHRTLRLRSLCGFANRRPTCLWG